MTAIILQFPSKTLKPKVQLCPRTLAIVNPGVPVAGLTCKYFYTGSMPCTGPLVCGLCGGRKP